MNAPGVCRPSLPSTGKYHSNKQNERGKEIRTPTRGRGGYAPSQSAARGVGALNFEMVRLYEPIVAEKEGAASCA